MFVESRAPEHISARRARRVAVLMWAGYLIVGVVVGLLWVLQTGPLWEHGLRLGAVLLVVPTGAHLIRRRWEAGRPATAPRISLLRLAAAKAVLVAAAMLATWLFEPTLPGVHGLVGLALALAIGVGGPLLHRHLTVPPAGAGSVRP
ncbi:hypothetical protein KO481_40315 [Nocardia sp. NEAU-G5]|uniref:ATP synthase subunit I n=1 Tax=Nocardia albiluteola TaxID=2842303 RepID=A0ABS6BE33_9NOCA|nr:hypothetical protein [Nocardia albiluteola]MBU3067751.1 hypothetical protein [Nocardia albiluteola]